MYIQRNIEARPRNHRCCGKTIIITYSESISVVSVMQHAKRIGRIMSSVACPALHYFFTVSHKRHVVREKVLLNIQRVFWFSLQLSCEKFLILRRIQREANINVYKSQVKYHLFLLDFNKAWIFSTDFRGKKNSDIEFHENPSSGNKPFHKDERAGGQARRSLRIAFRNFAICV